MFMQSQPNNSHVKAPNSKPARSFSARLRKFTNWTSSGSGDPPAIDMSSSSGSGDSRPQEEEEEVALPYEVQAQETLRDVARQGGYTLLSVQHGACAEGFIKFCDNPGWLHAISDELVQSRALLVVLNVDNPLDQAALNQLVKVLHSAGHQNIALFAVQLSECEEQMIPTKRNRARDVFESGVDDFFIKIDSGLYEAIELALIRLEVQKPGHQFVNDVCNKLQAAKVHFDFIMWQWIPSQLRLRAVAHVDKNLEEQEDGSIDGLKFIRHLGSGTYGTVHEARTDNRKSVAVKVMRKENISTIREAENIYRELELLTSLPPHPHLTRLLFMRHSLTTLYLCLSFGGDQTLSELANSQENCVFELGTSQELFRQVADAVRHMHQHRIFHRDIKPDNIAISGSEVCGYQAMLVDFGFAVKTEKPLTTMCGSLPFAAPEILDDNRSYYPGPVDAFALGVLLFELVQGQFSMENLLGWNRQARGIPASQRATQLRNLLAGGPPDINPSRDESQIMELLCGLLNVEPRARMTLSDLWTSPWLNNASSSHSTTDLLS